MSYTESMKHKKSTAKTATEVASKSQFTEIGEFIKAARIMRGKSQRELAAELNTSGPYIAQLEAGNYKYPTEFLKRLTRAERELALKIMIAYLKKELEL